MFECGKVPQFATHTCCFEVPSSKIHMSFVLCDASGELSRKEMILPVQGIDERL